MNLRWPLSSDRRTYDEEVLIAIEDIAATQHRFPSSLGTQEFPIAGLVGWHGNPCRMSGAPDELDVVLNGLSSDERDRLEKAIAQRFGQIPPSRSASVASTTSGSQHRQATPDFPAGPVGDQETSRPTNRRNRFSDSVPANQAGQAVREFETRLRRTSAQGNTQVQNNLHRRHWGEHFAAGNQGDHRQAAQPQQNQAEITPTVQEQPTIHPTATAQQVHQASLIKSLKALLVSSSPYRHPRSRKVHGELASPHKSIRAQAAKLATRRLLVNTLGLNSFISEVWLRVHKRNALPRVKSKTGYTWEEYKKLSKIQRSKLSQWVICQRHFSLKLTSFSYHKATADITFHRLIWLQISPLLGYSRLLRIVIKTLSRNKSFLAFQQAR